MSHKKATIHSYQLRYYTVIVAVLLGFFALIYRATQLQVIDAQYLRSQGEQRILRHEQLKAHRGIISDRNGVDLAVSIPVDSVWLNPSEIIKHEDIFKSSGWQQLAVLFERRPEELTEWVRARQSRKFVFLQRHTSPELAAYVKRLNLPGVNLIEESKRFYPTAEVSAHLVGFTDIDDNGQEGVEKSFNQWLDGEQGEELVLKDRRGNVIEKNGVVKPREPGRNLALSIDYRIQTIAYRELKRTVLQYGATSGSIVILDVETGEVLAMANQPSFNPNKLQERQVGLTKNRAVTDLFEPGSTVKPFTVLSAIESGQFSASSNIDTAPGVMRIGGSWIRDAANYGVLDVAGVLKKSSNVGISKIALAMDTENLLSAFFAVGLGMPSGAGFPGESAGFMRSDGQMSKVEKATLSYGYGLSVTALQLARAYLVLATGGLQKPVSLVKVDKPVEGTRVLSERSVESVIAMLEQVVSEAGTGRAAELTGYRVAGKTGTVRKAVAGGYGNDYVSIFAGIAPVTKPRLAAVIMVDSPRGDYYYGGEVAAPVFADIMRLALRMINATPDKLVERDKVKLSQTLEESA